MLVIQGGIYNASYGDDGGISSKLHVYVKKSTLHVVWPCIHFYTHHTKKSKILHFFLSIFICLYIGVYTGRGGGRGHKHGRLQCTRGNRYSMVVIIDNNVMDQGL